MKMVDSCASLELARLWDYLRRNNLKDYTLAEEEQYFRLVDEGEKPEVLCEHYRKYGTFK